MVDFKDDMDDFWDIARLVPKKREPLRQFSSSPKVKDFSLDSDGAKTSEVKIVADGATHAVMSGSGPSVYGVFATANEAKEAKSKLRELGYFAYAAKSV